MATPFDPPLAAAQVALPARRFHPFTLFFDLGAFARRALLPLLVALLQAPSALDIIFPAVLVIALGGRVLAWWRRTYAVEGGVLRTDEGVLSRRHRAVPLDRIQQVDVQRTLRHRILGVATLRVETAGDASGPEVALHVVGMADADALRALLLQSRTRGGEHGSGHEGEGEGEGERERTRTLVALSVAEIALAGVTGAPLGVMLTILFWPLQLLDDLPGNQIEGLDSGSLSATGGQLMLLAVVIVPIWLALAAGASLLRDGRFTLAGDGDAFVVRRGLLDQREAHVARSRIQVVTVGQNPLRRPLRRVGVRIQSAGTSGQASRISVPILPVASLDALLAEVFPGLALLPSLEAPPRAALRRRRVRGVALGLIGVLVFVAARIYPLAPVALLAGWWLGGVWYRALGHAVVDGPAGHFVVSRQGVLMRRTTVVPVAKVQSTRVQSSPFQRWNGLATAHLDVAARGTVPSVVDESTARARAIAATSRP